VLKVSGLNILVGNNGVEVNGALLRGTDLGVGVGIELLGLVHVEVDRVGPGDDEEGQGDDHGALSADAVCNVAKNNGDNGTAGDRSDQERCTTLGVATQASKRQSEDDGEDTRLYSC
jgi:hypothetical protein